MKLFIETHPESGLTLRAPDPLATALANASPMIVVPVQDIHFTNSVRSTAMKQGESQTRIKCA